jgi:hypothetical protein
MGAFQAVFALGNLHQLGAIDNTSMMMAKKARA